MPKKLRLTIAQINTTVGDIRGNLDKIRVALERARESGAELVTFPELAITGYPPEDLLFKKDFVSANLKALRTIASHTKRIAAIIGFVDRGRRGELYNAAAFISDGKLQAVYHKTRLPNYGVFDEKRYFSEGSRPLVVRVGGIRVGLTICEDIWQPDAYVYQKSFSGRADLLVNISASPFHANKQAEREGLLKGLAKKTGSLVLYHNLVGGQDELVFDGGSLLMDSQGTILARAARFKEGLVTADLSFPRGSKAVSFDRSVRPAAGSEGEIYEALKLGTRDYVLKNGFKKVLVGLSGGIDSALVCRIAVDALGADNVIAVTMPSPYTSKATLRDSRVLADNLGIRLIRLPISKVFKVFMSVLGGVRGGKRFDTTEQNLQARIRGTLLMALSNQWGYLVLTTGNKSEMATGYCTLYGDMAGGFAVIKDVPKTQVYRLARYRNSLSPAKDQIPESILKRPPTAELRPNQKDQDTLPPYPVLDKFLELYIERDAALPEILRSGVSRKYAQRSAGMVDGNEYKRRQSPPGIKITPKAFGRDRRMPITNRYRS